MRTNVTIMASCPCGSGQRLSTCCGQFMNAHDAVTRPIPATAEALMRSRYVAFVTENSAYLAATWHVSTRPSDIRLDPGRQWLGLKIIKAQPIQPGDTTAVVEFVASYRKTRGALAHPVDETLHEVSQFVRERGRWF